MEVGEGKFQGFSQSGQIFLNLQTKLVGNLVLLLLFLCDLVCFSVFLILFLFMYRNHTRGLAF